jgi:hypothetical protein
MVAGLSAVALRDCCFRVKARAGVAVPIYP